MELREISIEGFGKLHKFHTRLSGGIQVIYGKNESGKTTIRQFMAAMLFGMEKGRGRAARNDNYTKYRPVNGGIYGGFMVFEHHGVRYRILRDFQSGRDSARLFYEDTMEEISLSGQDLCHMIFEEDRNIFDHTVSMTQADIRTGREMKEILQNSMANLRSSQNTEINIRKAVDDLKAKRRETRKAPVFEQIGWLRNQIQNQSFDKARLRQCKREKEAIEKQLSEPKKYTIIQRIIRWIRRILGIDHEDVQDMELRHRLELLSMEEEQLSGQEAASLKTEAKYQEALEKKKEAEEELRAIDLAIKAIEQAASMVQKTFGEELNEKISEIFCGMTGGVYERVVMDDSMEMRLKKGADYVDMKYLSNATIEQLYFALRLSAAELLWSEDRFPLFLDDVFGNYDDERLEQTLFYLSRKCDRQIFLFTGRKELLNLMDKKGIDYHLMTL